MPPSVACADVLTSTGNHSAVRLAATHSARRARCRARPSRSSRPRRTSSTRLRCLLWSMTSARPTVWPHCELPAPRGSTGTLGVAAGVERGARRRRRRAAPARRPARPGRSTRRSHSGRAPRVEAARSPAHGARASAPRECADRVPGGDEPQRLRQRRVHAAHRRRARARRARRRPCCIEVRAQQRGEARRRRAPRAPSTIATCSSRGAVPLVAVEVRAEAHGSGCAGSACDTSASSSALRAAALMPVVDLRG